MDEESKFGLDVRIQGPSSAVHAVERSVRILLMPTFDSTKVTVVFVLGGPGAGGCSLTIVLFSILTPETVVR